MGFGAYDESEQENQATDASNITMGESRGDATHDGDVTFEGIEDTDELLDRLNDTENE